MTLTRFGFPVLLAVALSGCAVSRPYPMTLGEASKIGTPDAYADFLLFAPESSKRTRQKAQAQLDDWLKQQHFKSLDVCFITSLGFRFAGSVQCLLPGMSIGYSAQDSIVDALVSKLKKKGYASKRLPSISVTGDWGSTVRCSALWRNEKSEVEFLYGDARSPDNYPLTRAAIHLLENSDYKGCDAILLAFTERVNFLNAKYLNTDVSPVRSVMVPYLIFDLKQKRIVYAYRSNTEVERKTEDLPSDSPFVKQIYFRFTESEGEYYTRIAQQIISDFPPAP
jgi:hypothetical protein